MNIDQPALASPGTSRRKVLGVAAAAGAAGLIGGCGGGSGNGGEDAPAASSTGTSPPDGSSAPPATGSGEALAKTADVPVGGGLILAGPKVVLTQPSAGEFKAFSAVCTHMACTVSGISGDRITCPCHGSSFSIANGSPRGGPARSPLKAVSVKVEGDSIVST